MATSAPRITAPFTVEQLGPRLGAEIKGLDLKRPMDAETVAAFEDALIRHKMLVVRDQHLTSYQHLSVTALLGKLEIHPMRPQGVQPQIMPLNNDKDHPPLATNRWHTDATFRKSPPKYTILRCCVLPKLGGDTVWTDMEAAYDGLSDHFKRMIEGLRAVHDFPHIRKDMEKADASRAKIPDMVKRFPNPSHPVVRTHPVTGRKCIFVNSVFTQCIEGLKADESRTVLDVLFAQTLVPEYQVRLRWTQGAIVFWDNRSTQHYAPYDYTEQRLMERTTVEGDVPH